MFFKNWCFSILLLLSFHVCATVVTYTAPQQAIDKKLISPLFTVSVNSKPVPVYRGPEEALNNCFAYFDFGNETVTVDITRNSGDWGPDLVVRPRSLNVNAAKLNSKTVRLILTKNCNISIENDGTWRGDILMLFANPLVTDTEKNATYTFGPGYHAEYRTLSLSGGQSCYIDGGAFVEGLRVDIGSGCSLRGRGILSDDLRGGPDVISDWKKAYIGLTGENASLSGIIQFKPWKYGHWGCQPGFTTNAVIDNFHIVSQGGTDDGIDPQCVNSLIIKNCFIRVKDDCISPKVVPWFDSQRGKPCHDITIDNCVLFNSDWGCGFRIGVETAGEMYNIAMRNTDVIHATGTVIHEGALVVWAAAEGYIHDVSFDNVRIEDAEYTPGKDENRVISLIVKYYNGVDHSKGLGKIGTITFRNVTYSGQTNSEITGYSSTSNVFAVNFIDCNWNGKLVRSLTDMNCTANQYTSGISFLVNATRIRIVPDVSNLSLLPDTRLSNGAGGNKKAFDLSGKNLSNSSIAQFPFVIRTGLNKTVIYYNLSKVWNQ